MKTRALNRGGSPLRFTCFDTDSDATVGSEKVLARDTVVSLKLPRSVGD